MSEAVNKLLDQGARARLLSDSEKMAIYDELADFLHPLIDDPDASALAVLTNFISVLHNAFPTFFWTGFYRRVADQLLEVGPNQGTLGCLTIAYGRGVCGTVAQSGQTKIVDDVHAEPNHIGCDDKSRSEIVLPLFIGGQLAGVLDVDSALPSAFSAVDQERLEVLLTRLGKALESKDLGGVFALES